MKISGIIENRGRKPKHPKHGDFMNILDDILGGGENKTLGGFVIKVKERMKKKNLIELRYVYKNGKKTNEQKEDLIYTDSTIKTEIQKHLLYKKIQKRKQKRKKV